MEENWPQLATARGPFDAHLLGIRSATSGKEAGQTAHKKPAASAFAAADDADIDVDEGAWGNDGDYLIDEGGELEVFFF